MAQETESPVTTKTPALVGGTERGGLGGSMGQSNIETSAGFEVRSYRKAESGKFPIDSDGCLTRRPS